MTTSSTAPAGRWPGTAWSQIKDRFLLGSGTNAAKATGGASEHYHWTATGTYGSESLIYDTNGGSGGFSSRVVNGNMVTTMTNETAKIVQPSRQTSTLTANSMPPWYAAHIWVRTA